MARGLIGKALRGAAQGYAQAAPFIMEEKRQQNRLELDKRQQEAVRLRDERLAEIERKAQAAQNEFLSNQNRLDREGVESRHQDNMEINRASNDRAQKQLERTLDLLDIQIQQGNMDVESQRTVRNLQSLLADASPEEAREIAERLYAARGESVYQYETRDVFDPETDEKLRQLLQINRVTGEASIVNPGGDGSKKIPPGAIQELMQDLSPETRAEFDEFFGAGASDQILGPLQSDPASVSSPAASQGQSGGLISRPAGSMPPLPPLAPGSQYVSGPPEMIESSGRNPSRLRYPSTAPVRGVDRFSQR